MLKVIDLKDIKMTSINEKYSVGKNRKLFLNKKYLDFKNLLSLVCRKVDVEKPYRVDIYLKGYLDIDNPIKCILDSLICLENDRYIEELHVYKTPLKRGRPCDLKVFVGKSEIKC